MSISASRCYYHPERGAVATCAECGVGVCRECAVKDDRGRILCRTCGNEQLRLEHKAYRQWLKERGGKFREGKEFIVPGIVGIFLVAVFGVSLYYGIWDNAHLRNWGIRLFYAYMFFSAPFGYVAASGIFAPKYITLWERVGNWAAKAVSACFLGWVMFPFYFIRFIVKKICGSKNKT